jgi:hypothetical protein
MKKQDDYLWDGSGEPDPEVERLERALAGLRHARPAPSFETMPVELRRRRLPVVFPAAAAASLLIVMVALAWILVPRAGPDGAEVTSLQGSPRIGPSPIDARGRLPVGEWIETDAGARALIAVGRIGRIEILPRSRLRLLAARRTEHRLALERGSIHARVVAPPRIFLVETPASTAVDLGCAYHLVVDPEGATSLHVTSGWVSLEGKGRAAVVPAGARCRAWPGRGPGTPHYDDAPEALVAALARVDPPGVAAPDRGRALEEILAAARSRDALTLWHLIGGLASEERGPVFDRLAALVSPPDGVTREGVLAGDREMLERWWNAIGIGRPSWKQVRGIWRRTW